MPKSLNWPGVDSCQTIPDRYRVVLGTARAPVREAAGERVKEAAGAYSERRCVAAAELKHGASSED